MFGRSGVGLLRVFEGFRSRVGAEGVVKTTKELGTDGSQC